MSTQILVTLDTRRAKKDGTYPLLLRLGHQRRTIPISLDIFLQKKDWDEKSRQVKNSYKGSSSVTRLNNLIQKKKAEALDMILKLDESGALKTLSVSKIQQRIKQKHISVSFFDFTDEQIAELKSANRIGTARSYLELNSVLKKYWKGKDLLLSEITYSFLTKFESHHLAKGNAYNGLAVYMRGIRSIYNKAIKSGLVEKENYPFAHYKIKTTPTKKRAIDLESLTKIIALELPPEHICFHARNYFVASYMMYGMNFIDMAFLKKSEMVHARIQYRRSKTSKLYDIKITPALEKILNYYVSLDSDSEYVFPIIKRDTLALQHKDIQWARKRLNKKLKILAALCGIEENLTSYVSRHSFATQAMLHDIPLNAISTMLGHSSLKTTEIYLKALPNNILDSYNARLFEKLEG